MKEEYGALFLLVISRHLSLFFYTLTKANKKKKCKPRENSYNNFYIRQISSLGGFSQKDFCETLRFVIIKNKWGRKTRLIISPQGASSIWRIISVPDKLESVYIQTKSWLSSDDICPLFTLARR